MRRLSVIVTLFFFLGALQANQLPAPVPSQEIDMDKLSETLGHLLVRHLVTATGCDLSLDKIIQGMKDEREQKPAPLTEEQYEQMMAAVQQRCYEEMATKNLSQANLFLEENKKRPGITTFDEKLQYEVLQPGEGEAVSAESAPQIHYSGKLLDGTQFATSSGGEPIILPLSQSIEGFRKGIVGMKTGEKRRLYIHPDYAYGTGDHLPPNSLLILEIEVVKANTVNENANGSHSS